METPCTGLFFGHVKLNIIYNSYFIIHPFVNNFSVMKFSGKNEWSECLVLFIIFSIADDEKMNDNNLDLLVVPQYGRYPDYAG